MVDGPAPVPGDNTESHAIIKLHPNPVLYMREVNRCGRAPGVHASAAPLSRTVAVAGERRTNPHGPRRFLALVCRLPQEHFDKPGLLDYNFEIFKKAITEVPWRGALARQRAFPERGRSIPDRAARVACVAPQRTAST